MCVLYHANLSPYVCNPTVIIVNRTNPSKSTHTQILCDAYHVPSDTVITIHGVRCIGPLHAVRIVRRRVVARAYQPALRKTDGSVVPPMPMVMITTVIKTIKMVSDIRASATNGHKCAYRIVILHQQPTNRHPPCADQTESECHPADRSRRAPNSEDM